jgi:uncharacterized protein HemX
MNFSYTETTETTETRTDSEMSDDEAKKIVVKNTTFSISNIVIISIVMLYGIHKGASIFFKAKDQNIEYELTVDQNGNKRDLRKK